MARSTVAEARREAVVGELERGASIERATGEWGHLRLLTGMAMLFGCAGLLAIGEPDGRALLVVGSLLGFALIAYERHSQRRSVRHRRASTPPRRAS